MQVKLHQQIMQVILQECLLPLKTLKLEFAFTQVLQYHLILKIPILIS